MNAWVSVLRLASRNETLAIFHLETKNNILIRNYITFNTAIATTFQRQSISHVLVENCFEKWSKSKRFFSMYLISRARTEMMIGISFNAIRVNVLSHSLDHACGELFRWDSLVSSKITSVVGLTLLTAGSCFVSNRSQVLNMW